MEPTRGIQIYRDLIQGTDEWMAARCGLLTASEMDRVLTPTLKIANNAESRSHLWELLAQRITGYVEPHYISDDMMRGMDDESRARDLYAVRYAPVEQVGFVTNDRWGFTLGCSPDGLVGDDGLIECKSRRQKYQIQTLIENVGEQTAPQEYALQIQTSLLVTERKWCDFVSYSGGLPMATIRVKPDAAIQEAIIKAATAFEEKLAEKLATYRLLEKSGARLIPTERTPLQEIAV
ncbi:MAG: YqaJ viral recombinase family protein [Azospirillum sp.]|nr:YqaJ viral recombinase family protein [Azospirillum sp.]